VIELVLSNRIDDLLLRQADIAIRMLRPTQEALVTRRAGNITLGLHAHRRYLQQHPAPQDMRELGQHALIGFDRETAFIRSFMQATGNLQRAAFALRTDSDLAQLAAIRAGFGIGICQVNLARRDTRSGASAATAICDATRYLGRDARRFARQSALPDYVRCTGRWPASLHRRRCAIRGGHAMSELLSGANKRAQCMQCLRPQTTCICGWVQMIAPQVEVLILQHPLEVHNAKGSARLLHLSLAGSVLASGEQFAEPALRLCCTAAAAQRRDSRYCCIRICHC